MALLLVQESVGEPVDRLREKLTEVLGPDAAEHPSLRRPGTPMDADMVAAVRRWQSGAGLIADGVVGPRCLALLGLLKPAALELDLRLSAVGKLFPATKPANIARYLPYVEAALGVAGLTDRLMILSALATIRAETEGFVPISELPSRLNTLPGHPPFSVYDNRPKYGHTEPGDGERYRGRGFVQLTWKANYEKYGGKLEIPLVGHPDWANAPEAAALLLAGFVADRAGKLREALKQGDYKAARRLVNGGEHGLERYRDVFERAEAVWPAKALAGARNGRAARPARPSRLLRVSTRKDSADLRDRLYLPPPLSLPEVWPSAAHVSEFLPAYSRAGLVLNQGDEGACTGFGLACVINYMLWLRAGVPARMDGVSPRMLYTLARRYDEYEGESYEGSSCRGALKGWFHHGVCLEPDWPYQSGRATPPRYGYAQRATRQTLGVYYRVDTKCITDLQAAVHQHGAVFVSAFTHDGWDSVAEGRRGLPRGHADLPLIPFDGRPSQSGGHAFAIVGYEERGFVIQNSWGEDWGVGGFAVLGYLDWLANAMDAWVVSLGVPGVVEGRLAGGGAAGEGRAGADRRKWWDAGLAYRHSVVLGNDGRVSRYLTEDEPARKLMHQCCVLPDQWFRQDAGGRKRLVVYVHGGLNSEEAAIKRVSAMGRYFIGNGCYPLFLVWKTGLLESIGSILEDKTRQERERAAGRLSDATDLLIEKTVGRGFARPLWSEMKENAAFAFEARRGGMLLLDALQELGATWGEQFELHLMGHSAGSIALGHLLSALAARRRTQQDMELAKRLKSVHLYAPACTVAFAQQHYGLDEMVMRRLHVDVLSDRIERGDTVASIYRKSLLYLVSNALEPDLRTPILGLARTADPADSGWDGSSNTGEVLAAWRQAALASELASRTTVLDADRVTVANGGERVLQPAAHGSFDNDVAVVSRTLERITGGALQMPVEDLRGF